MIKYLADIRIQALDDVLLGSQTLQAVTSVPMETTLEAQVCKMIAIHSLRAWLHGEFQPGLKFRSAHQAEILLRLHGQFQPGRKTQISVRKFTEVRKHNRYACSRSFFSPGWNSSCNRGLKEQNHCFINWCQSAILQECLVKFVHFLLRIDKIDDGILA